MSRRLPRRSRKISHNFASQYYPVSYNNLATRLRECVMVPEPRSVMVHPRNEHATRGVAIYSHSRFRHSLSSAAAVAVPFFISIFHVAKFVPCQKGRSDSFQSAFYASGDRIRSHLKLGLVKGANRFTQRSGALSDHPPLGGELAHATLTNRAARKTRRHR